MPGKTAHLILYLKFGSTSVVTRWWFNLIRFGFDFFKLVSWNDLSSVNYRAIGWVNFPYTIIRMNNGMTWSLIVIFICIVSNVFHANESSFFNAYVYCIDIVSLGKSWGLKFHLIVVRYTHSIIKVDIVSFSCCQHRDLKYLFSHSHET